MYTIINEIHKYDNIIYTLYETPDTEAQVVEFVANEGIKAVAMPPQRANNDFLKNLTKAGAKIFLHTLNDADEMLAYKKQMIWGFYTDFITPGDMK